MTHPARVLVIGYGNRLRGDDAVGPLVAEAVAAWQQPGVEAIAVPQLLPELAATIVEARRVLFVDASEAVPEVIGFPLAPARASSAPGHVLRPDGLLGWTVSVFASCPAAWLLAIPARRFEVGAGLSLEAQGGVRAGLAWIRHWLTLHCA